MINPNKEAPMQQLPFKIISKNKSRTKLTSFGGIPLVMETYRSLGLPEVVGKHLKLKKRGWKESDIIEQLIGLQVAGGSCMDDIGDFGQDGLVSLTDNKSFCSPSAVRRFLHMFDKGVSESRVLGQAYVPEENMELKSLNELHRQVIRQIVKQKNPKYITLDADATLAFSDKQDCLATYKGPTGYQPIQAIWAETGVVVADEFRDGNVPAKFRALEFLIKCEANLPEGIKLRIRSDGAWYQHELLEYCQVKGYDFSIAADVRYGLMRFVLAMPEQDWKPLYKITEKGKVDTGKQWLEISFTTASLSQAQIKKRTDNYRYIITREEKDQLDIFEGPYKYQAIVTNMDWDGGRLVWWHYERAGTIENVNDILKNDLAGGILPCGTFGANAAWWRITCIAHNVVQCLKLIALPFEYFYTRMKKLRFKLFCIAGKIIRHARQTFLELARAGPTISILKTARGKLLEFAT
jgi:hypothetical protein